MQCNVLRDDKKFQSLDEGVHHLWFELEEIGIGFSIHDKIGNEVTLGVQEGGVAALPGLRALRIIRDHRMEKTLPILPSNTDKTTVGQIAQSNTVS